jgi:hypothetical protein
MNRILCDLCDEPFSAVFAMNVFFATFAMNRILSGLCGET